MLKAKNKILKLILFAIFFTQVGFNIKADLITTATDVMSRINNNAVSSHTFTFVIPHSVGPGETLSIAFQGGGFTFGGSYDYNDMVLSEGNSSNCSTATFTNKSLGAIPSGTIWGAVYSSSTVTFTSGTDSMTASKCIKVILNTNGAGHTITNPNVLSNTAYSININLPTYGDSAQIAVVILGDPSSLNDDQIQINAQVIPSISLNVDTNLSNCAINPGSNKNVNIGLLPPGFAKYSGSAIEYICIGGSTNSGMSIYVQSARANMTGGLDNGVNKISSATADLNLVGTTSGYGLRVAGLGTTSFGSFSAVSPYTSGTPGSVGMVNGTLGSATPILTASGRASVTSNNRIAVEVGAKADTSTTTGTYTDILTFTAFSL